MPALRRSIFSADWSLRVVTNAKRPVTDEFQVVRSTAGSGRWVPEMSPLRTTAVVGNIAKRSSPPAGAGHKRSFSLSVSFPESGLSLSGNHSFDGACILQPSASVAAFEDFVESNGGSLPSLTLRDGVMQMLAFYQGVSPDGCDGEKGDMLLFQWGTYDWGEGLHFEVNITRQFIESALEDDDAISQLQLTFDFPESASTSELGAGNRRCDGKSVLDEFRGFILLNPAFLAKADVDPPGVRLHHGYV